MNIDYALLVVAALYIAWGFLSTVRGRFALVLHANGLLPRMIRFGAGGLLGRWFTGYTKGLLRTWRALRLLRYLIGVAPLLAILGIFFWRTASGFAWDLLFLPLAFALTVALHEMGHAIAYARLRCTVLDVQMGLPLYGKTIALVSPDLNAYERATIGFAGSAMNSLVVLLAGLSLIGGQSSLQLYLVLTNLCFLANSLFPITKDYTDVLTNLEAWEQQEYILRGQTHGQELQG